MFGLASFIPSIVAGVGGFLGSRNKRKREEQAYNARLPQANLDADVSAARRGLGAGIMQASGVIGPEGKANLGRRVAPAKYVPQSGLIDDIGAGLGAAYNHAPTGMGGDGDASTIQGINLPTGINGDAGMDGVMGEGWGDPWGGYNEARSTIDSAIQPQAKNSTAQAAGALGMGPNALDWLDKALGTYWQSSPSSAYAKKAATRPVMMARGKQGMNSKHGKQVG